MSLPELVINTEAIRHNTTTLAAHCREYGMELIGITKAAPFAPVVDAMTAGGVRTFGDSRLSNIQALQHGEQPPAFQLIRSPSPRIAPDVLRHAALSLNTDPDVIASLGAAARATGKTHDVVLMVEVGDLREGLPPDEIIEIACRVDAIEGVTVAGIGASIGCRYTIYAQKSQLDLLATIQRDAASALKRPLPVCSIGGTVTIPNLLRGEFPDAINQFRVGEALLLGEDGAGEQPIPGMRGDALTLHAEVIEVRSLKAQPTRVLLALGYQDVNPDAIYPQNQAITVLDATSDHMILRSGETLQVGDTVAFTPNYHGLVQLSTSPYVTKRFVTDQRSDSVSTVS